MKYSKDDIKSQLKSAKNMINSVPTHKWWMNNGKKNQWASIATVKRTFGTWNNALEETFGSPSYTTPSPRMVVSCKECNTSFMKQPSEIKNPQPLLF